MNSSPKCRLKLYRGAEGERVSLLRGSSCCGGWLGACRLCNGGTLSDCAGLWIHKSAIATSRESGINFCFREGKRTALVSMMSHAAAATGTGIGRLGCTIFRRGVWVGCRRLLRLLADRHDVRRRLPDLFTMKAELGHRIRSRRVSSGADVRKLARLRHADCVEQCPSSGQSGNICSD